MTATGAVDLDACPTRGRRRLCRCGACLKCGFPKHTAVHGPVYGQPPGSKPWGHEFVTITTTPSEEPKR